MEETRRRRWLEPALDNNGDNDFIRTDNDVQKHLEEEFYRSAGYFHLLKVAGHVWTCVDAQWVTSRVWGPNSAGRRVSIWRQSWENHNPTAVVTLGNLKLSQYCVSLRVVFRGQALLEEEWSMCSMVCIRFSPRSSSRRAYFLRSVAFLPSSA